MNFKKSILSILLGLGLIGCAVEPAAVVEHNSLSSKEKSAGWQLLFNGESFSGWRNFKGEGVKPGWQVENGTMHHVKGGGDILFDKVYSDFELKLQWKISEAGNSGIFTRVSEDLKKPWMTGVEMQVLDNEKHGNGKNPLTCAGSAYALIAAPKGVSRKVGEWQDVRIVVKGSSYQFFLNGMQTAAFDVDSAEWKALIAKSKFNKMPHFGTKKKGFVCLQDHNDKVWYRNIKVLEL
jgi:hypothetical protein